MGLFSRPKDKQHSSVEPVPNGFRPARTAEHLISRPTIAPFIQQIHSLVALPNQYFSLFYLAPLKKFLALTQACDEAVITRRLACVVDGLRLRRAYLLPKGVDPERIREKKDLWTYATFIALLMYDLIHVVRPIVYQMPGTHSNQCYRWHPAISAPLDLPYVFKPTDSSPYLSLTTTLLVPPIFDEHCFQWLGQDSEAFNNAIESMVAPQATSSIGPLLIQIYQLGGEVPLSDRPARPNTAVIEPSDGNDPSSIQPTTTPTPSANPATKKPSARDMGRQFMQWLIAELDTNDPSAPSRSFIHPIHQGTAIVTPAIFKYYGAIRHLDWKVVQNGFIKLKRHRLQPGTHAHSHHLELPDGTTANVLIIPSLTA